MLRPSPLQPCPMFATFHCIAKRASMPYPSGGHRLVGLAWVSALNRLRKLQEQTAEALQASAFGTFRWADSLRFGDAIGRDAGRDPRRPWGPKPTPRRATWQRQRTA